MTVPERKLRHVFFRTRISVGQPEKPLEKRIWFLGETGEN